jgi:hypothetical protein
MQITDRQYIVSERPENTEFPVKDRRGIAIIFYVEDRQHNVN